MTAAVSFNRYVMANLVLLTGIVIYVVDRASTTSRHLAVPHLWRVYGTYLALRARALRGDPSERIHTIRRDQRSKYQHGTASNGEVANAKPSCQRFRRCFCKNP